jgi:hypothetical protein
MEKTIQDILGVSSIPKEREVPGTIEVQEREFWYIEDDGLGEFNKLFHKLLTAVDPPLHSRGGAITGGCSLTFPDGKVFHSFSYKGDLHGWKEQVIQGANKLGLKLGKINNESFVLLNGESFVLSDCDVNFY